MKILTVYNDEYFAKILFKNFGWCIGIEYEKLLDDEDTLLDLLSYIIKKEEVERIYEIEEVWVKGWMLFNKMVEERECVKLYM